MNMKKYFLFLMMALMIQEYARSADSPIPEWRPQNVDDTEPVDEAAQREDFEQWKKDIDGAFETIRKECVSWLDRAGPGLLEMDKRLYDYALCSTGIRVAMGPETYDQLLARENRWSAKLTRKFGSLISKRRYQTGSWRPQESYLNRSHLIEIEDPEREREGPESKAAGFREEKTISRLNENQRAFIEERLIEEQEKIKKLIEHEVASRGEREVRRVVLSPPDARMILRLGLHRHLRGRLLGKEEGGRLIKSEKTAEWGSTPEQVSKRDPKLYDFHYDETFKGRCHDGTVMNIMRKRLREVQYNTLKLACTLEVKKQLSRPETLNALLENGLGEEGVLRFEQLKRAAGCTAGVTARGPLLTSSSPVTWGIGRSVEEEPHTSGKISYV